MLRITRWIICMYSDLYTQQNKQHTIPKVFVLSLVALGALVTSQIFSWYSTAPAQASPIQLTSQSIANVSDTSAVLFFETSDACQAYVLFGSDSQKLTQSAYVSGENITQFVSRKIHAITLNELQPETKYFYKILANGKVIQTTGGNNFSFVTNPPKTIATSARKPIYGRVVNPDGSALSQAHVLIEARLSGQIESYYALTKETGEWLITLPITVGGADPLNIIISHEERQSSHIKTTVDRAAPIPQSIVIGSDYTFVPEGSNVLPAFTRRETEKSYPISLLYPEKDDVIPNTKPLFKGFGVPGTDVVVQVNSRPSYEGKTVVNTLGAWTLEAPKPFSPGKYIVMVTVKDNLGQSRILSRSFIIAKSGEQVLGEQTIATPSGLLTPFVSPSANLSPTGYSLLTATPPPIIITATPVQYISPTGELQRAGVEGSVWFPIIGSFLVALGAFLVRITSSVHD